MKHKSRIPTQQFRRACLGVICLLWLGHAPAAPLSFATAPAVLVNTALGTERGSAVVGVLKDGRTTYAFQTNGTVGSETQPGPLAEQAQQLYEIGSISKVFTGLLLAQAVERGDLALDDSLGTLLQGKATLVSREVASITLRQLVTHSSCLRRRPPDISEGQVKDNPYSTYDRRRLWAALSSLKLNDSPPCLASYSNFGLGLVGDILSERYGKPWHVLVHENITAPLGMHDTVQHLGDKSTRVAPGFDSAAPKSPWDFEALAGAGALRSTAADMLIFSRAIMAGSSGPFGNAAHRMLTPLGRYERSQIGYAVMMRGPPERRTFFHDGLTGGYHTLWMVAPDTQEAVVALTSNAQARPSKVLAGILIDRYPVAPANAAQELNQLTEYAGVFRVDKATAFTFALQDGVLYRRITGGGFRPLESAEVNRFIDAEAGVQYVFAREGGAVVSVAYTRGGGGLSGTRTSEPVPTIAVVPAALQHAYVGRFFLRRLVGDNLDFDVQAEGGQLTVKSGKWPRYPAFPIAGQSDRFAYEKKGIELQFERDAAGKVVTLVLHEGGVMRMQRVQE